MWCLSCCTTKKILVHLFLFWSLISIFIQAFTLRSTYNQSEPNYSLLLQSKELVSIPYKGDHPDWSYLNGKPWYEVDPTQQDHARFHSYLAMSIYGDYRKTCPKTFLKGFWVVEEFGFGYTAVIPEMRKVVLVFKGISSEDYAKLDWSPVSIDRFVIGCEGCQAAKSVVEAYLKIKTKTQNFNLAKRTVQSTKLLFSVTGLGFGGALAALAGLDLGSANHVHYSHNSGTPRFMNRQAVIRYDNVFQLLAGQSVVSGNDHYVQSVPLGTYSHLGQKLHIHGLKGQWLVNCFGFNENATCLGDGSSKKDHLYYFTQIGSCGKSIKGF